MGTRLWNYYPLKDRNIADSTAHNIMFLREKETPQLWWCERLAKQQKYMYFRRCVQSRKHSSHVSNNWLDFCIVFNAWVNQLTKLAVRFLSYSSLLLFYKMARTRSCRPEELTDTTYDQNIGTIDVDIVILDQTVFELLHPFIQSRTTWLGIKYSTHPINALSVRSLGWQGVKKSLGARWRHIKIDALTTLSVWLW